MSKQSYLTMSAVAALCLFVTLSSRAHAAGQDGMTVTIDPQTGQKRLPTPEEMDALRRATPSTKGLAAGQPVQPSVKTRRDGARGLRVGETHLVYEVVSRDADGKLSSQCVQGEAAAQQALAQPARTADKESSHESR